MPAAFGQHRSDRAVLDQYTDLISGVARGKGMEQSRLGRVAMGVAAIAGEEIKDAV
jgi:hypothetical protein